MKIPFICIIISLSVILTSCKSDISEPSGGSPRKEESYAEENHAEENHAEENHTEENRAEESYAEANRIVENYLSKEYGMNGKITDTRFQQYSEGITGGLFMYDFIFEGSDGKTSNIHYSSYADISEDSLSEHTLKIMDKE